MSLPKTESATVARSLAVARPKIAKLWDTELNALTPAQVHYGSNSRFHFRCPAGSDHVWETALRNLTKPTNPTGCPCCANKKASVTNSLRSLAGAVAEQWHPTLNGEKTPELVVAGSGLRAWWLCEREHSFQARVVDRAERGRGCGECLTQDRQATRSVAVVAPELSAQWHPTLNGARTPANTLAGSTESVVWVCVQDGHVWNATPDNRTRGLTGCPDCQQTRATAEFNLLTEHSTLAAEYHPSLNTVPVTSVHPASETLRYWLCSDTGLHVWLARPAARTRSNPTGCPVCNQGGWTTRALIATFAAFLAQEQQVAALDATERAVLFHSFGLLSAGNGAQQQMLADVVTGERSYADVYLGLGGSAEELARVRAIRAATDDLPDAPDETGDSPDAQDDSSSAEEGGGAGADLPLLGPGGGFDDDADAGEHAHAILAPLDSDLIRAASQDGDVLNYLLATRLAKMWMALDGDVSASAARQHAAFVAAVESDCGVAGDTLRSRVREEFLAEYADASAVSIPATWRSEHTPSLMQRLTALRVHRRRRVANWSGTGAGKTLAALLSAGVLEASTTLLICPNSMVDGWASEIATCYPHAAVSTKTLTPRFAGVDAATPKFVIVNFEQLQQPASRARVETLLATFPPEFVIIDELHNVKTRDGGGLPSARNALLSELLTTAAALRPELAVLAMTATPVLNDLAEARSLIELVTGQRYPELGTTPTITNTYRMHAMLAQIGLRMSGYRHPYELVEVPVTVSQRTLEEIVELGPAVTVLQLEQALLTTRIPAILAAIDGPTIIYSHYVGGIISTLVAAVAAAGHTVGEFTGENKNGLEDFRSGRTQVLVASAPISTGIDGLQDVCTNMIISCPAWTWAETEQLIGRCARKGQLGGKVTVTIVLATADVAGEPWSWDRNRLARLRRKQHLSASAVDGTVAAEHEVCAAEVLGVVTARLAQLREQQPTRLVHPLLDSTLVPQQHERHALVGPRREYGPLARLNARWYGAASARTQQRLSAGPAEWVRYHQLADAARLAWTTDPVQQAIAQLTEQPGLVIGDFGCGPRPLIADALAGSNEVHSFDHLSADPRVRAGDMSRTPLLAGSLDVAVFALSLMGRNNADYLREAHRTLRVGGQLMLWETATRITSTERVIGQLEQLGFDEVTVHSAGRFTHVRAVRADRPPLSWATLTFGASRPTLADAG